MKPSEECSTNVFVAEDTQCETEDDNETATTYL